jgi:hypothetical protein
MENAMTAQLPTFKRGDTFRLACTHKVDGVPTTVAALTIRSQIRTDTDVLVTALIADLLPQDTNPGQFVLRPSPSDVTTGWPTGIHNVDIELTSSGVVRSSETVQLPVAKDITQ